MILGAVLAWQGRPEEAEPWVQRAERTVRAEAEPAAGLAVHYVRGLLELARGRDADALAAFQAAERLAGRLAAPHLLIARARALLLHALVRLGDTERAEQALAGLGEQDRDTRGDAHRHGGAAARPRRPARGGRRARAGPGRLRSRDSGWAWLAHAFLLEAIARDALGDPAAAGRALERALDLAEPDGVLVPFLLHPAPGLLERHARHGTAHAALIGEILSLLAGRTPAAPPAAPRAAAGAAQRQRDTGPALPADQPDRAGDRQRAVRLAQHRQDPHAQPVRQARHPPPGRGRRPRPRPRPARPLPAQGPSQARWLTGSSTRSPATAGESIRQGLLPRSVAGRGGHRYRHGAPLPVRGNRSS